MFKVKYMVTKNNLYIKNTKIALDLVALAYGLSLIGLPSACLTNLQIFLFLSHIQKKNVSNHNRSQHIQVTDILKKYHSV